MRSLQHDFFVDYFILFTLLTFFASLMSFCCVCRVTYFSFFSFIAVTLNLFSFYIITFYFILSSVPLTFFTSSFS